MTGGTLRAANTYFLQNIARVVASATYKAKSHISIAGAGAVFMNIRSSAIFDNCSFIGNKALAAPSFANSSSVGYAQLTGAALQVTENSSCLFRSVTFEKNALSDSAAYPQGAVSVYGGVVSLLNYNAQATLRFQDCKFLSNRVDVFGSVYGGVVYAGGQRSALVISGTAFQGNYINSTSGRAVDRRFALGGVIYYSGNGFSVSSCTFVSNVLYRRHLYGTTSFAQGSILYAYNVITALSITDSSFSGNRMLIEARQSDKPPSLLLAHGTVLVVSSKAISISRCAFKANQVSIIGNATATQASGGECR